MKFAILASGFGSNLQAVIDAVGRGEITAEPALVLSNKKEAHALKRAEAAGIEAVFIDPKAYASREKFDQAVLEVLKVREIDFVVLAGYMRVLSDAFIAAYRGRILNVHPSLLPEFKGSIRAIEEAFKAGVKTTGVTVHFVTEDVDGGPVISQEKVAITPEDTLQTLEVKIHAVEHRLYPQAIQMYILNNSDK